MFPSLLAEFLTQNPYTYLKSFQDNLWHVKLIHFEIDSSFSATADTLEKAEAALINKLYPAKQTELKVSCGHGKMALTKKELRQLQIKVLTQSLSNEDYKVIDSIISYCILNNFK